MDAILPPALDPASFEALARDDPRLDAGVSEVARRHGIGSDARERFADGSLPVYAVGTEHVVKLYPPCYAHELEIEASSLDAVAGALEIPTPRAHATGELDGWRYLLMSRLHGESLAQAWPRVPPFDRERLMDRLGRALSSLHALDTRGLTVPRPDWATFVREQTDTALKRQRARGLAPHWLEQIPAFLAAVALPTEPPVLLHTEVMREHLLVEEAPSGWRLSGLFDFEPSMAGARDYEFASVGLFVTCGEPGLLRRLLLGYGRAEQDLDEGLSHRFLAYALLHRYANFPWYLRRLAPPDGVRSLADLAVRWWGLS